MSQIQKASFQQLTLERLYELLHLRVQVFVVEQECAYPEIDNIDFEANHLWIDDAQGLASYLRVVQEEEGHRIGRVVTRADARSKGLSRELIQYVLTTSQGPWVLSAQSYLHDWYDSFGFTQTGAEFLEDGIPHIPMRRETE